MKLVSLKLRNFKGIRELILDTQGGSLNVYGDNATGKTTIFDSFQWLLFDKDSFNRKDFQLKTLDDAGNEIHNLSHEVEGVLDLGARIVTLRKVFEEKYTKKRGNPTPEFTGHTTSYYIDGVPKPKKEYESFVSSIANENVFKLLTNPAYFNEQLHWQERRNVLLEIAGNVTDAEVIDAAVTLGNKDMLQLLTILNTGRSLDDHRKVIAARRAEINKELERLPVRIDEAQRGLPDIAGIDTLSLQRAIAANRSSINELQQQIVRIESGGEVVELRARKKEIEAEQLQLRTQHKEQLHLRMQGKQQELSVAQSGARDVSRTIEDHNRRMAALNKDVERLQHRMKVLRDSWHAKKEQEFEFHQDCTCPACGQAIPESQLAEAREKALEQFNTAKVVYLKGVNKDGKALKAELDAAMTEHNKLAGEIVTLERNLREANDSIARIQSELAAMQEQAPPVTESANYKTLSEEGADIDKRIAMLQQGTQHAVDDLNNRIAAFQHKIETMDTDIQRVKLHEQGQTRIKELTSQEKKLNAEYEQLEKELYLTEEFIRVKVNMLEERINSKFKHARFKLFNQQINGGLEECCETLYQGVPYTGGLNNAAKINVGLDIINTLAEHYQFNAPIFVDNREAVTKLIDTKAQIISLIVSAADKSLRIEHEPTQLKEAV